MVHVVGAVKKPGVYSLPRGSRVQDAIQAAGGPTAKADMASLNLVELLEDGAQIWIRGELPVGGYPESDHIDPAEEKFPDLININTATQVELESLPGIGPMRAKAIILYRQENGPFQEIEELLEISGIGPATFESLKDLITVGGAVSD
jgi:competence protein ComEA